MATRYFRFNSHFGGQPQRDSLLEKLLARADQSCTEEDWRAEAYGALNCKDPMPCLAAAIYLKARGSRHVPSEQCQWRSLATPLHYLAEMSNVRLASDGMLQLGNEEAAVLAGDFGRIWRDSQFRLEALGSLLFCSSTQPLQVAQSDPERALGHYIREFLPTGPDAPVLKRLMSEIEMWLFDHAVNTERRAGGVQPISALWPWGGGAPLETLATTSRGAAGDDVFFEAFAAEGGCPENVMVVHTAPGSPAWYGEPSRWLHLALEDLRRGVITRLVLSSATRRFELRRHWRYRILRRAKPWWEYFD